MEWTLLLETVTMIDGMAIVHYGLVLVEDGGISIVQTYNLMYSTKAHMELPSMASRTFFSS